jgi:tRNA U38,U39,U40 pseudouridine synthase TruA
MAALTEKVSNFSEKLHSRHEVDKKLGGTQENVSRTIQSMQMNQQFFREELEVEIEGERFKHSQICKK